MRRAGRTSMCPWEHHAGRDAGRWLAGGAADVCMLEAGLLAKPFTSSGGSLWKPIVEAGEVSA